MAVLIAPSPRIVVSHTWGVAPMPQRQWARPAPPMRPSRMPLHWELTVSSSPQTTFPITFDVIAPGLTDEIRPGYPADEPIIVQGQRYVPYVDLSEVDYGDEIQAGDVVGLTWSEFALVEPDDTTTVYAWAKLAQADPASYYYGYKEARVLSWGDIVTALSDERGEYETGNFSFVVSDHDKLIAGWLAHPTKRFLINRQMAWRMISDKDRRARRVPRLMARGVLTGYEPLSPLHYRLDCADFVSSRFSAQNESKQIPQDTIDRIAFVSCPAAVIGKAVPIIYGRVSDAGSATAAPTITGTTAHGYYPDAGVHSLGWGDLTSSADVPANVIVTAGALSGQPGVPTGLAAVVEGTPGSTTYTYSVSAYNGNGQSAKAGTVSVSNGPAVRTSVNKIKIDWNAVAGADGYVVWGRNGDSTWLDVMTSGETSYRDDNDNDTEKSGDPIDDVGMSTGVPNSEYGVMVTAVDATGRESDPQPYYTNQPGAGLNGAFPAHVPRVVVASGQQVNVSWDAATGAVKYRVYIGYYSFGAKWQQFIEVTAPTVAVAFTRNPPMGTAIVAGNITPGASPILYTSGWWAYAVQAVLGDGSTAPSVEALGLSLPYRRPIRIEWWPVAGAIEYRVIRRQWGGVGVVTQWDRQWTIPIAQIDGTGHGYFDDDMLDTNVTYLATGLSAPTGAVPTTYIGEIADVFGTLWSGFLIAGHAIKEIEDVFLDGVKVSPTLYGVTWAVPGKPGIRDFFEWTGDPEYRELDGRRYTLLYVRGADASNATTNNKPITVNLKGIEDVGDGSGELIASIPLQYRHFLINFGFQRYYTGAWLTAPTWAPLDPTLAQLDEASFEAAHAIGIVRVGGEGYIGGGIVGANGEQLTLREWIARWNLSADVRSYFSRQQQFAVTMFDPTTVPNPARRVTQINDIVKGSFRISPQRGQFFTEVRYNYMRHWVRNAWDRADQSLIDLDAETNFKQKMIGPARDFYFVRSATVADDINGKYLARHNRPPLVATFTMHFGGLNLELGEIIPITHLDGIGDAGWLDEPVQLLRRRINPNKFTVTYEAEDVSHVLAP